ncbi:MAG: tetratricopeptide repeat protein [Flavobacteriales bacterium]
MSSKQLIVVVSAIAAVVLLYFLPVKSSSVVPAEIANTAAPKSADQKIDEALAAMQVKPMDGIKLLKEVLQEDPKNVRALELLSMMSLQTGQHDKAVVYLERLNEVKPSWEVQRLVGDAYIALKDTAKARSIFVKLYESAPDQKQKESVQQVLKQLK